MSVNTIIYDLSLMWPEFTGMSPDTKDLVVTSNGYGYTGYPGVNLTEQKIISKVITRCSDNLIEVDIDELLSQLDGIYE